MTILETFIKLRDDLKTWVTNNLNQKANISYVDEKFDSISEFDPTEIQEAIDANTIAIDAKVDKVEGMGLSTNDYTTSEKDKLESVEANANFYEHPVYDSHSSGLYKVTVDDEGHVSGATLAEKEDIVALGIPAQDTTYEEEISDLSDRIDDVENSINTTNETLEGVAQDFESYKTTNNEAVSTNASGIEANKTAIEAIQNDYLTSTNKEQLEDEISKVSEKATANASAIEILNGEGDGSVKQSIDNAFNEFAANVTNDDVVNTYKELIDYAATHGPEFTELVGKVDTIDTHVGEVETDLSDYKTTVSDQFTEVDTTINTMQETLENKADLEHAHEINEVNALQEFLDELQNAIESNSEDISTKADLEHNHDDFYYTKDEILESITVEDIDDICALDYSDGEGVDPVTAATKHWVEKYYQPKGDYLTETDIADLIADVKSELQEEIVIAIDDAETNATNSDVVVLAEVQKSISAVQTVIANKIDIPESAEVGQVLSVKNIDADGNITWETITPEAAEGSGGGSGYTPIKGIDYWTDTDKTEMINDVIAALPVYNGEVEVV